MDQSTVLKQNVKKLEEKIGFYFAGLIGFCLFAYMMSQPILVLFSFFFFSKASKGLLAYEEAKEALRKPPSEEQD